MTLKRLENNECRYPYLSPSELSSRLRKKAILFLPIGSLEWHNEHLPLGTDTFHAIELSMRLCKDIGGVVLPAFWWNTGGCHDHVSTYHMPEDLYRVALKNVCIGLKPIPAKLLVLVNGHGGGYQKETPAIKYNLSCSVNELWVIGGWHWLEQRLMWREMIRWEKQEREEEFAQLDFLSILSIAT